MIQFTCKLKLNERVRAKCSRHPATTQRRTPLVDGFREHYFRIARKPFPIHTLRGTIRSTLCPWLPQPG